MMKLIAHLILFVSTALMVLSCGTSDKDKTETVSESKNEITDSNNSAKIQKAKNDSIAKAKKSIMDASLKKMRKERDDFSNTTFYFPAGSPKGYSSQVVPYIGDASGYRYLKIRFQYTADNWLFVKKIMFKCDSKILEYYPTNMKRENNSGKIHEWEDVDPNDQIKQILFWISHADKVKVRYEGDIHYDERTMTKSEQERVLEIYDLFY